MFAQVYSAGLLGVDAFLVEVEVDVVRTSGDQVRFLIVGLPDAAVQESRERVRSAIKNNGFSFPISRLTVNLAPADVRKEGPSFDLPVALGVLIGTGQLFAPQAGDYVVAGELGLDGEVRPIAGALPITLGARAKKKRAVIVPKANGREAAVVHGIDVYAVDTLQEAAAVLAESGEQQPLPPEDPGKLLETPPYDVDFGDVKGQEHVKRALEVAAAGGHNALLLGPPGSGKTMLARRLPTVLPPFAFEEALEVTKIYSITGLLQQRKEALVTTRPFRAPHHTVSDAGLIGGGTIPRPGEVSLAHHGVLFLDELPEFRRDALEVLRQPLEDGVVTISRAAAALTYPARCMLLAAANPCPCGYLGDTLKACTCTQQQVQRYHQRVSGPLLDRIDIHLEVPRLKEEELLRPPAGEKSAAIRGRVLRARERQRARFQETKVPSNAAMEARHLRKYCVLGPDAQALLKTAIHQIGLSARAHDRILKLARTIADLAGEETIQTPHVAEAVQYRTLDRRMWG